MTPLSLPRGVELAGPVTPACERVLTPEALAFLAELQREFGGERELLLAQRIERQARIDAGELPDFLPETAAIREGDWQVSPPPAALLDRRCEITGPVERKMMINALNSGARMFRADFEDSNAPTWANAIDGQVNVMDAVRRTITLDQGEKQYRLNDEIATLLIRPRGWHMVERHLLIDGKPISGGLFDFGLVVFHNAKQQLANGEGPFFYLPKLESHLEARLWNAVFTFAEDRLGLQRGDIRATVLIENLLAAFEMEEILYELREHSAGLNAGRWDYIFSVIKKLRNCEGYVMPDRVRVTMTVPFMRAYSELLVKTCHRRGAHAIGGMAAFIPSRRDAEVNAVAMAKVTEDKRREAGDGFDGTWVAHPDLVPIATAEFDAVLGDRPNQVSRLREDVNVTATPGEVTEDGLRLNASVGIRYVQSWLAGVGAAAIDNLMEDAATAEISRSQVWQWVSQGVIERSRAAAIVDEVAAELGPAAAQAAELFRTMAFSKEFTDFLTLPAYELID